MKLSDEIDILRDKLNKAVLNEQDLSIYRIVELSQALDKLIVKYYSKNVENNMKRNAY